MVIASTRDPAALQAGLTAWFETVLAGSDPAVGGVESPGATGMSSETLLFDLTATLAGERRTERLVARLAPHDDDFPVFPAYDLGLQFRCLDLVRTHSDVPVPRPRWHEHDPRWVGSPFFVMDRVDGIVPPDNPPYVFGGWVVDATPAQRARMQTNAVGILADLHAIDLSGVDTSFLAGSAYGEEVGGGDLDRQVAGQRAYYEWAREGRRFTVIERALAWLTANRPADPSPSVLTWGDARIGNVLWRDFEPVAVLDWEMATIGPPEVDLAWMVHIADFFADVAATMEVSPIEGFFARDDVIADYERRTGRPVRDYDWYEIFAALRYAVVSIRAGAASVLAGTMPAPDHHDGLILNGGLLTAALDRVGA